MPTNPAQRLLALLPAIYREDEFLGRFLSSFEQVLVGFESQIDGIPTLFDPGTTRTDFLPWLSSWTAFTLRADLDEQHHRDFLANVIPLYRRRGTKASLQNLLKIFTKGQATVTESDTVASHFHVTINLPPGTPQDQLRQSAIARAIVEMEKPAHTSYDIDFAFPSLQIAKASTIGVDTLFGSGSGT